MTHVPGPLERFFERFLDTESQAVDHDETSNRTHSGDSISPDSVSTEELNSEDLTQASSGEVVKVGTSPPDLTTGSVEAGLWQEDSNSPTTNGSTTDSLTHTLGDSFDQVLVDISIGNTNGAGSAFPLWIQVNGVSTADYNYFSQGGGFNNGVSEVYIGDLSEGGHRTVPMAGRWDFRWNIGQPTTSDNLADIVQAGQSSSITSPLSSVRVFNRDGDTMDDVTIAVYGRDLP